MNYSRTSVGLSLRFRRWSRRAWAVFASLGQEVTIGTLVSALTGQSMVKSQVPAGAMNCEEIQHLEEEQEELEEVQLQVVALLPVSLAVPAGAAAFVLQAKILFNGWYGFSRISRFLFPPPHPFALTRLVSKKCITQQTLQVPPQLTINN